MVNLNIKELNITQIIKKQYDGLIKVKNDAKCAALAEKNYGSLKNYQDAVFLCLGTGIGGSCFMQGKELIPTRNSGFVVFSFNVVTNNNIKETNSKHITKQACE